MCATYLTALQVGRLFDVTGAAARGFSGRSAALRILQGGAALLVRRCGLEIAKCGAFELRIGVVAAARCVYGPAPGWSFLGSRSSIRALLICLVLFGLGRHETGPAGSVPANGRARHSGPHCPTKHQLLAFMSDHVREEPRRRLVVAPTPVGGFHPPPANSGILLRLGKLSGPGVSSWDPA
jgi:hypothetical protein